MTVLLPPETMRDRDFGGDLLAARHEEGEEILRTIQENRAVVIAGEHDVGKTRLVARASASLTLDHAVRVVTVDLRRTATDTRLAWRWLRALAAAIAGPAAFSHIVAMAPATWPRSTRAADVRIRRLLGARTDWALAERPQELSPAEAARALAEAREATIDCARESPTVLLFDHFEAPLDPPRPPFDVDKLIWGLRPSATGAEGLNVTVVCHPAVLRDVVGKDGPLFGAPALTVESPATSVWRTALGEDDALLGLIDDVMVRTRGHIPSTVLLLHALRDASGWSVGAAFDALALTQHQHAERCMRHAATLHRLGAQILQALARGERPYQATPEARSTRDIAHALTAMWRSGLLRRPEQGRWELTDPLVAHLLRGMH